MIEIELYLLWVDILCLSIHPSNTPHPPHPPPQAARSVFQRGYDHLKAQELKEERLLLLDAWRAVEREKGDAQGRDAGGVVAVAWWLVVGG